MENNLVITAIGADRPGIVNRISETILESGCNISDSRMTVLGGEFALLLLITGKWNQLAKLETHIPRLGEELKLTVSTKRTGKEPRTGDTLAYSIEVVSIDHPGIVHRIANFFSGREINIRELNTTSYNAAHTGTPMFTINMIINIPSSVRLANLREDFLEFCDTLNMDAVMEPLKG